MSPDATLAPEILALDAQIAQLSTSFEFLPSLTPINAQDAKRAFLADGREPAFEYPELPVDPEVVHAQLDAVDLSSIDDATVRSLLSHKHREMELQADMLAARGTDRFLPLAIEMFGNIAPRLRERAEDILSFTPENAADDERVDAASFLAMAQAEVDYYRSMHPGISMHAEIDDHAAGVMVSGDTLLVPPTTMIAPQRAHAVIQHEVGTHLVTRANGAAQQLKVLGAGLAGYDETQEGLAVLAEIACGGITVSRLRTLAARVVTVHRMMDGASFADCHAALVTEGFGKGSAFTTTMRVFRSGGLTKDVVYLRGLTDLLDHVAAGGDLGLLLVGKFALRDLPLITDLHDRGIVTDPLIRPRYLDDPDAASRIQRAATVDHLTDILSPTEGEPR